MRTRTLLSLSGLLALALACSTVEYTGRSQFNVVPESVMNSLGVEAYTEAGQQYPESKDTQKRALIERVGKRIAAAVERDYQWEFKLFEANVVNAWCLPGGKVGFYTGILPICENEDGIAVVMGHEVAHAFARHGAERMTQNVVVKLGLGAADLVLSGSSPGTHDGIMQALGFTTNLGVLKYSRDHESEADELGLRFMVRAGYNPEESVKLWERMARLSEGKAPPEFLSTHPSSEHRAARLRELIPRIVAEESARKGSGGGDGAARKNIGNRKL